MLRIEIKPEEYWNEITEEFETDEGGAVFNLEHSLVSIHKWESKWHKSFLSDRNKKTDEEMVDYIRCMVVNHTGDMAMLKRLNVNQMMEIKEYIDNPMSATYMGKADENTRHGIHDTPTAEYLYWQMIEFGIPFECRKWHLNQLIALIHVCSVKSGSGGKMSQKDLMKRNHALNSARRSRHHSRG